MKPRYGFITRAFAIGVTTFLVPALFGAASPSRPNILFILSDDQNPDTLGCFGGKVLTPTLDKLCAEGVKFTRAHNSSSVCTPSRYTCMTGQYASRCTTGQFLKTCPPGTPANVGFNVQVAPGSWNVARVLREHGYWTGFVGKWHTGAPPMLPIPADANLRDPEVARKLAENQRRLCDYIQRAGFSYAASVYRGNLADHKLDALKYHNMEWVTMDVSLNLQETALKRHPGYWDADQLYDLQADPEERVNLVKDPQYAQTVAELRGLLKGWLVGFDRPFGESVP